jgi:hypothetical protein
MAVFHFCEKWEGIKFGGFDNVNRRYLFGMEEMEFSSLGTFIFLAITCQSKMTRNNV